MSGASASNKGRRQNRHGRQQKANVGERAREVLQQIDENNPTIKAFMQYNTELVEKQDRHERIVKLSRDITIESKRIIFLLHNSNLDINTEKREQVFTEAENRLNVLIQNNFKAIASELQHQDSYQYLRGYTAGLQEFVEAYLFYSYLKTDEITSWHKINKGLTYKKNDEEEEQEQDNKPVTLLFPEVEFILGIGDFTGELMRKCINSLGAGNTDNCFKICSYVKDIYTGFLGTNNIGYKEVSRKLYVLRQSLAKMELVCYNICVRGSEIPKHMLANVIAAADENTEDDEGFF